MWTQVYSHANYRLAGHQGNEGGGDLRMPKLGRAASILKAGMAFRSNSGCVSGWTGRKDLLISAILNRTFLLQGM